MIEQHGRLDALVVTAAPSGQTLDASRHADPDQVLRAVDAKAMSFLRLANAALPIMARAGYGRIVGVSGQNAFLTGNVTGSVRNAALIIFHAGYEPRAIDRLDRACLSASHRAVRAEQLPGIPLNVGLSAHPGTPP